MELKLLGGEVKLLFKLKIYGELNIEDGITLIDKKGLKVEFKGVEIHLEKLSAISRGNIWFLKESEVRKILEWIKKSEMERDGFNKFFSLWVAFNVFYNLYSDESSEKNKVKDVLNLLERQEKKEIVEKLRKKVENWFSDVHVLRIRYGNRYEEVKEKCKGFLEKEDYEKTLEYLMLCLYAVRCNLFHGEKRLTNRRQNKLLNQAYNILKTIFCVLLAKYLSKG